jgi:hypothetical protein
MMATRCARHIWKNYGKCLSKMAGRTLLVQLLFAVVCVSFSMGANPPKMRPYSGIGVLILSEKVAGDPDDPIYLYQEPGLTRLGTFDSSRLTGNGWIFGSQTPQTYLIVMARKGSWLRVCYDDSGREAWIESRRRITFQSWDDFLRRRMIRMLPGLRKQYYQLFQQPDSSAGVVLTPKQSIRVLNLEGCRAMVMVDQKSIGWLRWCDEDGRLNVGLE